MIPYKFREDLVLTEVNNNSESYLVIEDPFLITSSLALPLEYKPIIEKLDGVKSKEEIADELRDTSLEITPEQLSILIKNFEIMSLLESPSCKIAKDNINEYLSSEYKESVCNGSSYPNNTAELDEFIEGILSLGDNNNQEKIKALLAPHIDLRLKNESAKVYGKAFSSIKNLEDIDTIILFGTAHYKSSDDLMFTRKHYKTPYGVIDTDKELLDEIEKTSDIHYDDMAHFKEHSLELHIIFLQYLFAGKDIKILPVLTGAFNDYIAGSEYPEDNSDYVQIINSIQSASKKLGRKTFVCASGDLSHIGKKFGDDFAAEEELTRIFDEDNELLEAVSAGNRKHFFDLIRDNNDKNHVCGTAPFYTAMFYTMAEKGRLLEYSHWNESETESAVSFAGSVLF